MIKKIIITLSSLYFISCSSNKEKDIQVTKKSSPESLYISAMENFKEQNNKNLPKSKLIKKEVIKKESKKGIAIKKFVLWKSNKEKASDYPSYLCYYLDFSDGRKDPIKRKIYPFEDEKIGLNHFKKL